MPPTSPILGYHLPILTSNLPKIMLHIIYPSLALQPWPPLTNAANVSCPGLPSSNSYIQSSSNHAPHHLSITGTTALVSSNKCRQHLLSWATSSNSYIHSSSNHAPHHLSLTGTTPLVSSNKCRQHLLSWASIFQFLHPIFLKSCSTPSIHHWHYSPGLL